MPLHLTKVAFACPSVDFLAERLRGRADSGPLFITTRYLPKRHAEVAGEAAAGAGDLGGSSLYWILKHQLVARSPITGFGEAEDGRVAIHLLPDLVLVQARPKRAHQGWRYLEHADAPVDLGGDTGGLGAMPPALVGRLAELALI